MAGIWCSVELKKAIEVGYVISNIHSRFKHKIISGLMQKYVDFFLKVKPCNSGVKNAADCDELNKYHTDLGLDVNISPGETSKHPGMKQIAKLCLNSLWGKLDNVAGWIRLITTGKMIRGELLRQY